MPSSSQLALRSFAAAAAAVCLMAVPPPAGAQYFGQNKVQYQDFDFRVMKTRHFDIYYYPEEEAAVADAAQMAERWYTRLSRVLSHQFAQRQPLILYASHTHFEQTNALSGFIGETHGRRHRADEASRRAAHGRADGGDGPRARPRARARVPVRHDGRGGTAQQRQRADRHPAPAVVHRGHGRVPLARRRRSRTPRCGCATPSSATRCRASISSTVPSTSPTATARRSGPTWPAAGETRPCSRGLRASVRGNMDAVRILEGITGLPSKRAVQAVARGAAGPVPAAHRGQAEAHHLRARGHHREERGRAQPRARLSAPTATPWPSSRRRTSSRSTSTWPTRVPGRSDAGSSRRRPTPISRACSSSAPRAASTPPAGGSCSGRWRGAKRRSTCARRAGGHRPQDYKIAEVDEIFDPSFSPDGRQVVFSAQVGGLTDLFVYDLEASRLRRLTSDAYADLQPSWSPDGRSIVFSTDRFSTNLADPERRQLPPGPHRARTAPTSGPCPASRTRRTSTPTGRRTGGASSSSPTATASATCTGSTWTAGSPRRSPTSSPGPAASPPSARPSPWAATAWCTASTSRASTGSTPSKDRAWRGRPSATPAIACARPCCRRASARARRWRRCIASRPSACPRVRRSSPRSTSPSSRSTTSVRPRSAWGWDPPARTSAAGCRSSSATSSASTTSAPCCR